MDPFANTSVRGLKGVTNGQHDTPSAATSSGLTASERLPYRSPPTGMGSPNPIAPGPYRPSGAPPPGPSTTAPRAPTTSCQQCPIYVAKITELEAKIVANLEDMYDLRMYVAGEMER
eukprot:4283413-Heterocapsa_arctica.AAC.1